MAVYNRAVGMPDYSSSSGGYFIPELWSPRIQVRFYAKSVFRDISNTMYEGEIKKFGDVVNIRTYPDITIGNYVKGQTLDIQVPNSTPTSLTIDSGKYFNVLVDDVDEAQSDIALLDEYTKTAGEQMAEAIDTDVLQNVYSSASSDNIGATAGVNTSGFDLGASTAPESLTKTNILDYIVDCATVLDEQNVPEDERWMVLPPLFTNLISKSDSFRVPCSGNIAMKNLVNCKNAEMPTCSQGSEKSELGPTTRTSNLNQFDMVKVPRALNTC